jgi:hypothetical protein
MIMGNSNSAVEEKATPSRLPLSKCPSPETVASEHEEFNSEELKEQGKGKTETLQSLQRNTGSPASQLCEEEKLIAADSNTSSNSDIKFQTPQRKSTQSHNVNEQGSDIYITTFFIGLSFRKGLARADVSHTIQVRTK